MSYNWTDETCYNINYILPSLENYGRVQALLKRDIITHLSPRTTKRNLIDKIKIEFIVVVNML